MIRFLLALLLFLASWAVWAGPYAAYPFGDYHWRSPVASSAALPVSGNFPGDARVELTTFSIYIWNGSSWQQISGGGGGTVTNVSASGPLASSGGATPNISLTGIVSTANGGTNHGDYTAGSVIFAGAGGTSLAQDNANFFWDDTNLTLLLGTNTPAFYTGFYLSRNILNSFGDGELISVGAQVTSDGSNGVSAIFDSIGPNVASGVTASGEFNGVFSEATRANSTDFGTVGAVYAFNGLFGQEQFGDFGSNPSIITTKMAGVKISPFSNIGTITNLYDFYAAPGTLTGATVTNRYGLYIDVDDVGSKQSWISGVTTLGGTAFLTAANASLVVNNGHIASKQTTAPVATVNANAGTGATCSVTSATDSKFHLALTTTATAPGIGAQCSVAFNKAYNAAPVAVFSPTDANGGNLSVLSAVYSTTDTGHFVINFGNLDAAGHAYSWDVILME